MTTKDILDSEKVSQDIQHQIDLHKAAHNRKLHKRTPLESLEDKGLLNVQKLKEEFLKVLERKSDLPSSQRQAVIDIVGPAWRRAFSSLPAENESNEEESEKRKES